MSSFGGVGNPVSLPFLQLSGGTLTGALTITGPASGSAAITIPEGAEIQFGAGADAWISSNGTNDIWVGGSLRIGAGASSTLTGSGSNINFGGGLATNGTYRSVSAATTLGVGATTFALTRNVHVVTGNGGGNTVATITGGTTGTLLTMLFVDANVTITDTAAATADTINLSAAFTSAANTTLTLVHNGTKWFEVARSVNG